MDHSPTISVTLSADLLDHLRRLAEAQHVPMSWLVTGLICDTIATCNERADLTGAWRRRAVSVTGPSSAWN